MLLHAWINGRTYCCTTWFFIWARTSPHISTNRCHNRQLSRYGLLPWTCEMRVINKLMLVSGGVNLSMGLSLAIQQDLAAGAMNLIMGVYITALAWRAL